MGELLAALALLASAQHSESRTVNLVLPHVLRAGEAAVLLVTVGVIPSGAEIEIVTMSGQQAGVISPYGIRAGQESGTYTVPLPAGGISGRRVCLRLSLRANGKVRAPTMKQVKRVRVAIQK
jgi:hypothetical protein